MTDQTTAPPVLTEEQWQIIKANDDARTQAAISACRAQELGLMANAEFLKTQIAPLSHRNAIAVHAMQGIISNPAFRNLLRDDHSIVEGTVDVAFMLADAMMEKMEESK